MEVKLIGAVQNIIMDLAVSFYCRALQDQGMSEEEALKIFIENFVLTDLENPEKIIEVYIYLKKLLRS